MPRTRVVLVRHGQSRATVDRIAGGIIGCKGLTDLGRRQALALAERLAATGELADTTALLASTLPRAIETAELLAPALGHVPVGTDDGLCEIDPGEGDGLSWEEFEARYGGLVVPSEPFRPVAPGGESWAAFGIRIGATLQRLAAAHAGGTVVAACHGGVVEQSVLHCLGLPMQFPPALRIGEPPNTSMTEYRVTTDEGRPQHWQLMRFADAGHLARLEPQAG